MMGKVWRTQLQKDFKFIVKERIKNGHQHFLLFPQCLLLFSKVNPPSPIAHSVTHRASEQEVGDPQHDLYSFWGLMIVNATGFILVSQLSNDNDYVGKQPVVWKEYYVEHLFKDLQEGISRCTDHRNITEILVTSNFSFSHSVFCSFR